MRFSICLALVFLTCVVTFADTVELTSGQQLVGTRIIGLPNSLTLVTNAITLEVNLARILTIDLSGEQVVIVTTTNDTLSGDFDLLLPSITLETETGETRIPLDQIVRLEFSRETDQPRAFTASVIVRDGRSFEGDLYSDFPNTLTVEADGISTSTRLESIVRVEMGVPTTIETANTSASGALTSILPTWVDVETQFGYYRVPTDMIQEIRFPESEAPSAQDSFAAESGTTTAGIGFKVWQGLPFVVGNLSWNHLGLELGLGFGGYTGSGAIPDVTSIWYSGSARYLVLIPQVQRMIRPYVGGGVIGLTITGSAGSGTSSVNIFGFDAVVGMELLFAPLGVPLTMFAGADWSFLGGDSALVYQLGIRLDFAL
jgi:hypothetical protein